MIDPSSSEDEDIEEDRSVHQGAGGRGRGGPPQGAAAAPVGHGARYHSSSGGGGPAVGSVGSGGYGAGGVGSPGGLGSTGGGSPGPGALAAGVGPHGRRGAKSGLSASSDLDGTGSQPGLDVPGSNHMAGSARSSLSPSMSAHQDAANYSKGQRPTSPSPSVASEKTEQELQVTKKCCVDIYLTDALDPYLQKVNVLFILARAQDKQEREVEERKSRIQLYVFITRCIAYPFNAKQPADMQKRHLKITKQQLETLCSRFQVFIISVIRNYKPLFRAEALVS